MKLVKLMVVYAYFRFVYGVRIARMVGEGYDTNVLYMWYEPNRLISAERSLEGEGDFAYYVTGEISFWEQVRERGIKAVASEITTLLHFELDVGSVNRKTTVMTLKARINLYEIGQVWSVLLRCIGVISVIPVIYVVPGLILPLGFLAYVYGAKTIVRIIVQLRFRHPWYI